jgi:hypothetical protein
MSAYSKSGSSDKAAKIRSNTPLSAHRRKRFHTEDHLPKLGGKSRHGAPARTSHKTASINSLLSSPDRPGSPFLPGKRGAIRSHWASFNNVRLKAGPHFSSLESDLRHFGNLSRPTRVNRSHQTQMSTGPSAAIGKYAVWRSKCKQLLGARPRIIWNVGRPAPSKIALAPS